MVVWLAFLSLSFSLLSFSLLTFSLLTLSLTLGCGTTPNGSPDGAVTGGQPGASAGSRGSTGGSPVLSGGGTGGSAGIGGLPAGVRLPPAGAPFDYQIGGAYPPPSGVTVVSRDRASSPAAGLYNICYVNAFQVQAGDTSSWASQHADLLLKDAQGRAVVDSNWNETLVDTRTTAQRQALLAVIGPWLDACAAAGFDAVEIDNLDSYTRSQGLLSADDNAAFMTLLASRAHGLALAVGQKNAPDLAARAREMGTDFAITESCLRFGECGSYQQTYGGRVFDIEYLREDFEAGCEAGAGFSLILRDVDVSTPSSSSYVDDRC